MNWLADFSISYSIFLMIYGLVMLMLLFFAASSLYHLMKYGFLSPIGIFMTFLLIAGTATILFISFSELRVFDWQGAIILDLSGEVNTF